MTQRIKQAGAAVTAALGAFIASAEPAEANSKPVEGTEQHTLLKDYGDFITKMKKPTGGGCCGLTDGRANYEEIVTGDPGFPYEVIMYETIDGVPLDEPVTVKIPANIVLSPESAEEICAPIRQAAEAQGRSSTCVVPPFNVLWAKDNVKADFTKQVWRINNGSDEFKMDEPVDANIHEMTQLYCYIPEQNTF